MNKEKIGSVKQPIHRQSVQAGIFCRKHFFLNEWFKSSSKDIPFFIICLLHWFGRKATDTIPFQNMLYPMHYDLFLYIRCTWDFRPLF